MMMNYYFYRYYGDGDYDRSVIGDGDYDNSIGGSGSSDDDDNTW